jgi:hypothetical protein
MPSGETSCVAPLCERVMLKKEAAEQQREEDPLVTPNCMWRQGGRQGSMHLPCQGCRCQFLGFIRTITMRLPAMRLAVRITASTIMYVIFISKRDAATRRPLRSLGGLRPKWRSPGRLLYAPCGSVRLRAICSVQSAALKSESNPNPSRASTA